MYRRTTLMTRGNSYHVNQKEVGIHILDSIKGNQGVGNKSSMIPNEQSSDAGPRHPTTIS